jgi:hypothetical protein
MRWHRAGITGEVTSDWLYGGEIRPSPCSVPPATTIALSRTNLGGFIITIITIILRTDSVICL